MTDIANTVVPRDPQQANKPLSLSERNAEKLARFAQRLEQNRLWHVLPKGQSDLVESTAVFDSQSGLLYPADALRSFLDSNPFVLVRSDKDDRELATLHSATRLLWTNKASDTDHTLSAGITVVAEGRWAELSNWRLPTKDVLYAFAAATDNPHRGNREYRLKSCGDEDFYSWLTNDGRVDTDAGCWNIPDSSSGRVFACNTLWQESSHADMLLDIVTWGWRLVSATGVFPQAGTRFQRLTADRLLQTLQQEELSLVAVKGGEEPGGELFDPETFNVVQDLSDVDYVSCRLPMLDHSRLSDPEKGLWELWGEPAEFTSRFGLVARDPWQDVQRRAVAIDFGTSSTVVAMDTVSGGRELLRIGVRDFYQAVQPQHFENPTVLECLDFSAFGKAWTGRAYRPELDWSWMRAAHEAQASFRDNPGDTKVLASILPRLKQWALRSDRCRVRLTDRLGQEIELAAHNERNPVRGQPLCVTADYSFDPIELYAWYLGMAINWRERGIFLKYHLSFPVKYPREVKDRILASFRRGLQRSLPQSLVDHHPQVLNDFEVKDWASEPAAYAAAAMAHLRIDPSDAGVPYAVFDFGGGTTDFDYGLLRWANSQEEDQGYEQVFEHLASGGDQHLGGENLLEHLVYASFQNNLGALRAARIQFTKPLDASPFVGSEAFLAPTQAAQTNTVMLAAVLRPFLEGEKPDLLPQIKLDLIDADGNKKTCELVFDAPALDVLLAGRIRDGVQAFFAELARLRPELPCESPIHVLLAGNASRSRHVKTLFDTQGEFWRELLTSAFGETPPEIMVHPPLPMDESNPHAPTTKTGVALGLLRLAPGENTLLLDHVHRRHDGQAPFAWFVGRLRRRQLAPVLTPGATYGHWQDAGPLQQGVFNLYVTSSPRAHTGLEEGDPELKKIRLDFPDAPAEAHLFARPVGPHTLEVAAATSDTELDNSAIRKLYLE